MAIINFSTFSLNAAPLSSDYLVGFRADGTPFYENTLTVDALYTYVSTRFNAASGSYVSYSDSFQNVSLPNQLTVTGSIVGGGTIQTNNGSLISKGTTNSVIAYDRTVGSSAYANFYKSSGNNILGDSIAGTVITYTSGGNVGIGTSSPNTTLTVVGNVSATGNINVGGNVLVKNQLLELVPAGAVMTFAMSGAPSGWLPCDGRTSTTTGSGANLFAAIGYTYGGSGGTFNLPDLRGYFVRGHDNGRGIDTGRAFGSNQTDAFQDHNHRAIAGTGGAGASTNGAYGKGVDSLDPYSNLIRMASDGTTGYRTATETRPKNIAMLYCIKY